jgi:hypothetical protein
MKYEYSEIVKYPYHMYLSAPIYVRLIHGVEHLKNVLVVEK